MFHSDVYYVFHSRESESAVVFVIGVGRLGVYVGSGC